MTTKWLEDTIKNKKLTYAALATLIFLGVSIPVTYMEWEDPDELVNRSRIYQYLYNQTHEAYQGSDMICLYPTGVFLQTGVFFAILYLLTKWLDDSDLSHGAIAKRTFYTTLLFFMISSSDAYMLMADDITCPNKKSILIHAVVFFVILTLTLYFPKDE